MQIIGLASIVHSVPTLAVSRDPNDDKFLAAALAGSADCIVTEDLDLLDIGVYEGIQIVSAVTFLRTLTTLENSGR